MIQGSCLCGAFAFEIDGWVSDLHTDQGDLDEDGVGDVFDLMTCGNGIREFTEQCDDGNLLADDACSATCESLILPFKSLRISKAKFDPNGRWKGQQISIQGFFELGDGNNGIDPTSEEVILRIGSLEKVVPVSSFHELPGRSKAARKRMRYSLFEFGSTVWWIEIQGAGQFKLKAWGKSLFDAGRTGPVPFSLQIGDDGGSTEFDADIAGHVPPDSNGKKK